MTFEDEVAHMLDGIYVEDLTSAENSIVRLLVKSGHLKIVDEEDGEQTVTLAK